MDTTKSTSRRQGRLREEGFEGSPMANVRDDESRQWAGHIRLSLRASWHNTTKPTGLGGKVNAAFVHGKFTFLSGEICLPCGRRLMSRIRKGFTRMTKNPACPFAVDGDESSREPRNRQRLMTNPVAPGMATYRVSQSRQGGTEGIVGHLTEGPNAERSEAIP